MGDIGSSEFFETRRDEPRVVGTLRARSMNGSNGIVCTGRPDVRFVTRLSAVTKSR